MSLSILNVEAWNWSVQDIETYLYQRVSRSARRSNYHVIHAVYSDIIQPCLNERTPYVYDAKRKTVVTAEVPFESTTVPLTDFYSAFAWLVSVTQPELSSSRDGIRILASFTRICDALHRKFFDSSSPTSIPKKLPQVSRVTLICGWLAVELTDDSFRKAIPSSSARDKLREARAWYARDVWRAADPPSYYALSSESEESGSDGEMGTGRRRKGTKIVKLDSEAVGLLKKYKDSYVCEHATELCLACGSWTALVDRSLHTC